MIKREKYQELRSEYLHDPEQRKYDFPAEIRSKVFRVPVFAFVIRFEWHSWKSDWHRENYEQLRAARHGEA